MIKENINQIKVLFIDDDTEDMELFEESLKLYAPDSLLTWLNDGRKISGYFEGSEGTPCNIIFLDIGMPLMDGLNCLKILRKINNLDTIPIIIFSTYRFDEYVEKSLAGGANMYVQKPSDFRLYNLMFKKIFCNNWQSRLLNTNKNNYLLEIEGETMFS